MLVGRQAKGSLVHFRNLSQARLVISARFILDPSVLDEHRNVVLAVFSSGPAKVINIAIELVRPSRLQGVTQALLNLGFVSFQPQSVDSVFETSVLGKEIDKCCLEWIESAMFTFRLENRVRAGMECSWL